MSYLDQTRLLVAKREDEDSPMIVGAYPQSTWEVVPDEDFDRWKRETAESFFGPDWTAYDYLEVVMTFPASKLCAMFEAREIVPASMTRPTSDSE